MPLGSSDAFVNRDAGCVCCVRCVPNYPRGLVALIVIGDPSVNLEAARQVKHRGKTKQRMAELLDSRRLSSSTRTPRPRPGIGAQRSVPRWAKLDTASGRLAPGLAGAPAAAPQSSRSGALTISSQMRNSGHPARITTPPRRSRTRACVRQRADRSRSDPI